MAASLAYYTVILLAPLIIILIAIVGPLFGTAAAESYIVGAIAGIAGEESARAVQAIVHNANQHGSGVLATALGVVLLLLGAGAVVGQLQQSLNVIFGVTPKPDIDWWVLLRARFSFLCDAFSHWFSPAGIAYRHDRFILRNDSALRCVVSTSGTATNLRGGMTTSAGPFPFISPANLTIAAE
ncbi:MAG: hypothetical protein GEU77_02540 [Deltaproteobacteria bacterium]|nr:hypothetical protein [Deltaproteobacteria bacterium]